jgi:hypothetical protein
MAEKWDKQVLEFLKYTGNELKRTGEQLRTDAQKLLTEVQDPKKQAKVKEGLEQLRTWAVETGKQAADRMESAVRQVEEAVEGAFGRQAGAGTNPPPASQATPSVPPAEPPAAAKKAPAKKATKSIGRKKTAAKAPAGGASKPRTAKKAPKSIGRKKPARPAT